MAVNQEQGATDSGIFNGRSPPTLFHRGRKRRRLIRGLCGDIFAKNFSFLGRQCRGISEVTKGRIRTKGARTLEQRTDNGLRKNTGAEKSPRTSPREHHSGLEASVLSEKNYPWKSSPLPVLQKSILDVITLINKRRSMDTRSFQVEDLSLVLHVYLIKKNFILLFLQNITRVVLE